MTQSSVDNFTMSLTKEEAGNERGKFERRTDTNTGVLQMVRCSSDEKARGSQGNQATAISLFKDQDHELHPKTMNLFGKKGIQKTRNVQAANTQPNKNSLAKGLRNSANHLKLQSNAQKRLTSRKVRNFGKDSSNRSSPVNLSVNSYSIFGRNMANKTR